MPTSVHPPTPVPVPTSRRLRARLSAHLRGPAADWAATIARLVLAAVFGWAGLTKIGDPAGSVRAVRAYELLPDGVATVVGRGLPALELTLAVALLLGVALRLSAGVAAVLLAAFTLGILSAAARGLQIDCGCFGGGGPTEDPQYAGEILRDLGLGVLAVGAMLHGRSRLSLDPRPPAGPAEPSDPRRARAAAHRHQAALTRHQATRRAIAVGVAATLLAAGGAGVAIGAAALPPVPTRVPAGATTAGGIVVGDAGSARPVIVYADPQCPACRQFDQLAGPVLADAVDAGEITVEYRMRSFLGEESVRAVAALGAAADAGRFADLLAALYASQPTERSGGFTVPDLLVIARTVGLTAPAFVDAVRDQRYAAWARQIDDRASRDGNTGTPQVLLDGRVLDPDVAFDPAALRSALTG